MKTIRLMILRSLRILGVLMALMTSITTGNLYAQVRIGNETNPVKGAVLDLSNDATGYIGGLKLPNVAIISLTEIPTSFKEFATTATAAEKAALKGTIVYNTTASGNILEGAYQWDGTKWILITTAGAANGQVLKWNGSAWILAADDGFTKGNITTGTSVSTATAPLVVDVGTNRLVTGNSAFTVNNTAPLWNANKIQGQNVTTTAPTAGQTLVADGAGNLNWKTPAAGFVYKAGNGGVAITSATYNIAPDETFLMWNTNDVVQATFPSGVPYGHQIWVANKLNGTVQFTPQPLSIAYSSLIGATSACFMYTEFGWVMITGF